MISNLGVLGAMVLPAMVGLAGLGACRFCCCEGEEKGDGMAANRREEGPV